MTQEGLPHRSNPIKMPNAPVAGVPASGGLGDRSRRISCGGRRECCVEVGDEVEILFNINRIPTPGPYHIRVGDELHIEFLSESDKSRAVTVRPDGRISLPLLGPVTAAGQTPDAFARQLQDKYSGSIPGAQLTVNVSKSHSPLDDFLEVLGTGAKARSLTEKVLPDGTLAVPLLQAIPARRRTLSEVQNEINSGYAAKGLNLFVSIVPRTL